MVTLTRTATEKVHDFIQEHGVDGPVGLRVAVLPGGCSGFQYGLNIEDAPDIVACQRQHELRSEVLTLASGNEVVAERLRNPGQGPHGTSSGMVKTSIVRPSPRIA